MDFQFDQRDFSKQLDRLRRVVRKDTGELLRAQTRLFVADACALTPPTGGNPLGAAGTARNATSLPGNSLSARKQGQDAVARDIRRLCLSFDDLEMAKGEGRMAVNLRGLLRAGQYGTALQVLDRAGVRVESIEATATVEVLNRHRDRRGRVVRGRRVLVRDGRSIVRLLRSQQALVGRAKAGWKRAADALGLRLPRWITRHEEPGIFTEQGRGDNRSIIVGNALGYAQKLDQTANIMNRAYRNRLRNLRAQVEAATAAAARKAGARVK